MKPKRQRKGQKRIEELKVYIKDARQSLQINNYKDKSLEFNINEAEKVLHRLEKQIQNQNK